MGSLSEPILKNPRLNPKSVGRPQRWRPTLLGFIMTLRRKAPQRLIFNWEGRSYLIDDQVNQSSHGEASAASIVITRLALNPNWSREIDVRPCSSFFDKLF